MEEEGIKALKEEGVKAVTSVKSAEVFDLVKGKVDENQLD